MIPQLSGHPILEINIFHITCTIIFCPFLFHFQSFLSRSARNKENKNGTRTGFKLHYVTQFMDFRVFESALGS